MPSSSRRGAGLIGFIFLFVFIVLMWIFVFSEMFSFAGNAALAGGATGFSGFLWANLNLLFFLCLVIVVAVYFNLGGTQ